MDGLMDGINSHKISRLKDKDVVELIIVIVLRWIPALCQGVR
jgi:hypothetical protein